MQHSVFISYSSREADVAIKVCEYLENNGIICWMAPRNVIAGSNYATQIVSAIKSCSVLVLLASENTNASGHVSNEVSIAFDSKKVIIPFKLQDFEFTDEYLYFLGRKHWIEAHMDFNSGLELLKSTINEVLEIKSENVYPEKDTHTEPEYKMDLGENNIKSELTRNIGRNEIVDIIIEKSRKYPYNLYEKISDDESYRDFKTYAEHLFKYTMVCFKHNKLVNTQEDLVTLLKEELQTIKGANISVKGAPGSAKNMLLQLIFYKMLDDFKCGNSDYLPFYISSSFYEKLPYNPSDVYSQMKSILSKEFKEFFDYVDVNKDVRPVLFIEAIREHIVSKVSPENVVFELWKKYGKFNRITTVDVGLIKNRARLKRVIPIIGDGNGYIVSTKPVPLEDAQSCKEIIAAIIKMYNYDIESDAVYTAMKDMKFTTVDIFLIRLVIKEMLSSYDFSEIQLYDMYEKLALSELYGDEDRLTKVSVELFEYVFNESYNVNTIEYNGSVWSLPHKHSSFLEFLISYYFIKKIEDFKNNTVYSFFSTVLTSMSNHFLASYMHENYLLQEMISEFVITNYDNFNIQQRSNGAYWLGRITYKSISSNTTAFLLNEFNRLKPVVKTNNKNTQENCDNHFLFRAVCNGLLHQGQATILDEYLCIVVTNNIANSINRGATIEYFGDDYQIAAHDAYSFDADPNLGEQVIRILNGRIEASLNARTGNFVENDLVTLLTMLQSRMQSSGRVSKYDVKFYVEKACEYLKIYQTRPQNIVSGKLVSYFKSVEEDFHQYLDSKTFDISPIIYNRYKNLRQVKRVQWISRNIDDPESISEHTFNTWLMAMLFLPDEYDSEDYNKKEILDMLLVHDLAEAVLGDQEIKFNESQKELKAQNEELRKLFLKGTYPDIANLTYYYNVWTGYYNGININARAARDLNLLQTVYTFCEYCCEYPEKFSVDDIKSWLNEKTNLKTEIGHRLFKRLVTDNKAFEYVIKQSETQN